MLILVLLKLFLISPQQLSVIDSGYDSLLFINLAYSLANGEWLGDYNHLTLIKGMVYPLFIAVNSWLGLPLLFTQHILYAIAAFILVIALLPLIKNNWFRLMLFALVLFSPEANSVFTTAVARGNLNMSLNLMLFAGFIAVFLRRYNNKRTWIKWLAFSGLVLFLHQNTREENVMVLPLLLMLSVATIFLNIRRKITQTNQNQTRFNRQALLKTTGIIAAPYLILILGNLSLSTINYFYYGGFIRNEVKSAAFTDAMAALTAIETDYWSINVPVPREARMQAYRVSPAFAKLKPVLEDPSNGWKNFGEGDPEEIKAGWFLWAFREAAVQLGYHKSLSKSQQFYGQVAKEINTAFENGQLKKKKIFSMFSFSWDNRFLMPTLKTFLKTITFVTSYQDFTPYPVLPPKNQEVIIRFQNITNEPANVSTEDEILDHYPSKLKYIILFKGKALYALNRIVFYFALALYVWFTLLLFFKKWRVHLLNYWIVASAFLAFGMLRLLLIAYMKVTALDVAVHMYYLSVGYPAILIFEFLTIYYLIAYIFERKIALTQ